MTSTKRGERGSRNLSHVFGFYCLETIDLLLFFVDGGGGGEGVRFCRRHRIMLLSSFARYLCTRWIVCMYLCSKFAVQTNLVGPTQLVSYINTLCTLSVCSLSM